MHHKLVWWGRVSFVVLATSLATAQSRTAEALDTWALQASLYPVVKSVHKPSGANVAIHGDVLVVGFPDSVIEGVGTILFNSLLVKYPLSLKIKSLQLTSKSCATFRSLSE